MELLLRLRKQFGELFLFFVGALPFFFVHPRQQCIPSGAGFSFFSPMPDYQTGVAGVVQRYLHSEGQLLQQALTSERK